MKKGEKRYVEIPDESESGDLWICEIKGSPTRKGTVPVEWRSGPLKGRPARIETRSLGELVE